MSPGEAFSLPSPPPEVEGFLTLLKAHLSPGGAGATLPLALWLLLAGVAFTLVAVPALWRWMGFIITVIHETGHAVAALTVCSRLQGIRINGDHSGDTRYVTTTFLPFRLWAGWWGYPFPCLAGFTALWAAYHGWSGAALTVTALIAVVITLQVRNLVAFLAIGATTVGVAAAWWWLPPHLLTPLVILAGFLSLFGGVRSLSNLVTLHLRGETEESDAAILARESFIVPAPLWLASFLGAGAYACYLTANLLSPLLPR